MSLELKMTEAEMNSVRAKAAQFNKAMNRAADPQKEAMGQDKFLLLLTKQLSHQDPMNPMDNTQFISQMAQFSSLEQMTKVNTTLTDIAKMAGTMNLQSLQHFLGKSISYREAGVSEPLMGKVTGIEIGETGVSLLKVKKEGEGNFVSIRPESVAAIHYVPDLEKAKTAYGQTN